MLRAALPAGVLVLVGVLAAHGSSYVVLQNDDKDSLVRVSENGKSVKIIAGGAAGFGLAVDGMGNYVVAAGSALRRVSPGGVVSTIAEAPPGTEWTAVCVDGDGSIAVADRMHSVLWRVSADGKSVAKAAAYADGAYAGYVALNGEASGECLLLAEGIIDSTRTPVTRFFRVKRGGAAVEIPLQGVRPWSPAAMAPDGRGGAFFAVSHVSFHDLTAAIYHVTPDGMLTKVGKLPDSASLGIGLARNPMTGELIIATHGLLSLMSASGSVLTPLADVRALISPTALIFDPEQ